MKWHLYWRNTEEGIEVDGPIPRIGEKIAFENGFGTVMNVSYAVLKGKVTWISVSAR